MIAKQILITAITNSETVYFLVTKYINHCLSFFQTSDFKPLRTLFFLSRKKTECWKMSLCNPKKKRKGCDGKITMQNNTFAMLRGVPTLYLATELRDHFLFGFFNVLPLNNLGTHEKLITFAIGFWTMAVKPTPLQTASISFTRLMRERLRETREILALSLYFSFGNFDTIFKVFKKFVMLFQMCNDKVFCTEWGVTQVTIVNFHQIRTFFVLFFLINFGS